MADDVFTTDDDIDYEIENVEPMPGPFTYGDLEHRTQIEITANESEVVGAVINELKHERNLFVQGGRLVAVREDQPNPALLMNDDPTPLIVPLSLANIREIITRNCELVGAYGDAVHPPAWLPAMIGGRSEWSGLRRVRAIVEHPVLRADGTIAFERGHDQLTDLILMPSCRLDEVPDLPTHADALRARDELLEIIVDFPFASPVHRSAALAAMLTPIARPAFDGPSPLFLIDKNVMGAGGTLLADATGVLATGRPIPRMSAAREPEEERKKITSIALSGTSLVLIDNVGGQLGHDSLAAALTGTTWTDRLLGSNTMITVPLAVTWFATGNNIELSADMARRTCYNRLESPEEKPEERGGFKHPKLLAWIREERPRLLCAALTLLRAHYLYGNGGRELRPWGSFDGWSRVVRGAIVWCGLPDPGDAREELAAHADQDRNALRDLLESWTLTFGDRGATVVEALTAINSDHIAGDAIALRAAVLEVAPARPGSLPTARALGMKIRQARGRVIDGAAFADRGKSNSGARWVVRRVSGQEKKGGL